MSILCLNCFCLTQTVVWFIEELKWPLTKFFKVPLSGEFDIKSLKYCQKQTLWPWNPLKRSIIYDSSNFSFIIFTIQKSTFLTFWAKITIEDIIWGLGTCRSLNILNTCAKDPWLLTKCTIRPFRALTSCTISSFFN